MESVKVAIIGAGNMGGAIAEGLAQGNSVATSHVIVANPSSEKLERLQKKYAEIKVTHSNEEAAEYADIIVLAVKPWKVEEVLHTLSIRPSQILVSVAAGVSCQELADMVKPGVAIIRAIPNTAISEQASLTLVATQNASDEQVGLVMGLFNEMGIAMKVEESKLAAATALTSCGIAYVFKYVQAAMLAGVELGITPKEGMKMLAQTLEGAAQILLKNEHTHPAIEIEKVTTPGGVTIKGINSLEHSGFNSAVIKAIKESAI